MNIPRKNKNTPQLSSRNSLAGSSWHGQNEFHQRCKINSKPARINKNDPAQQSQ